MMKHTTTILKKMLRSATLALAGLMMLIPQPALAQQQPKIDYSANDVNYYDPRGNNVCGGTGNGDSITRFLQVLSDQENGGKVTGDSGTGAKGKYQYLDDTWKESSKNYYPPAMAYANANLAPEEVQDAVAYIEYSHKFKVFNGDLFKLAVSHFYPIANVDPSKLDIYPPGNVITPRQYANDIIAKMASGEGKNIPIKASQAPDFQKYLDAFGGGGGGGADNGQACSGGVVAGDIIKTALSMAWPTPGHGKTQQDATSEYQKDMPHYNPSSAAQSNDPWSDCGVFVATVITATVDPSYQKRGTTSQIDYIKSHPDKYDFFTDSSYTQSSGKLQRGDILVNYGHTYIFTGPYQGGDKKSYNSAAASWGDHVPQADNWYPGFFVARVKK